MTQQANTEVRSIKVLALQSSIAKREVQVLDVRLPFDYFGGRIPGAMNLPAASFFNMCDSIPRVVPLVFVCNDGQESAKIAVRAQAAGFLNASILDGGMDAWLAEDLPMETISDGVVPR